MPALDIEKVLRCSSLPSLSAVAVQVLELTQNENVKLKEIADVVEKDQALTTKILRTVNSSYYGLAKPCPTIARAMAYLGLNTVKSLVLGFTLVDVTKQSQDGFDLIDYWSRCLYSAAAARRIAMQSGACDPEEAFIAALIQDMGMLAIHASAPSPYACLVQQTKGDHRRLPEMERAVFGFDHTEVGSRLAEQWRFPSQFVDAIRHHHDADPCHHLSLVRPVWLGYELATLVRLSDPAPALSRVSMRADKWFGLSRDEVKRLIQGITEDAGELGHLFKVETGPPPDIDRILSEAEGAFVQHQLTVQHEVDTLQQSNDELSSQVNTDPLTKVNNRKSFDEKTATCFGQASSFDGFVGLLLMDIDGFKQINDQFGHHVGDAVLVDVAARLTQNVREVDHVCRFGGDEFAVILPGASIREAAVAARRVCSTIADEPFVTDQTDEIGEPLRVTVSVGVAVYEPRTHAAFQSPEQFVQAADKALYVAKRAQGNCIRMFSPVRKESEAA
ncbi:MAG: GGDEF domain-containing protein [Planctomycetota bacterium]|nr:GGDEF domain-containing protein [Planctomycetota bacterium]